MPLILYKNSQISPINDSVHLLQPILTVSIKVYLQLVLVLLDVTGQQQYGNNGNIELKHALIINFL
jgi:hypothetical protein